MKYIRLKFIEEQINNGERVLDVGTDHGLLPIMLVQDGITNSAVASDINQEPLNAAITNIREEGLDSIIETKLMNGIEDINEDDYDVIVIAGMGGNTISEIIQQTKFNSRLLIHSTTSLELVRETIEKIDYKISNEWVVFEGKVHNVIIEAIPGEMKLSEKDLFMGPSLMNKVDDQVINYYNHLFEVFERNSKLSGDDELRIKERNWLKEKLWNEQN